MRTRHVCRPLVALAVLCLGVGACSSEPDPPTPAPSPNPEPSDESCLTADHAVAAIQSGAEPEWDQVHQSAAVEAADGGVYFVGIRYDQYDVEATTVWAVNSLTGDVGTIEAVGQVSAEAATWPEGEWPVTTQEVSDAIDCAGG